jgi:transposase-like protein
LKSIENIDKLSIQTISNLSENRVRRIFQEIKYKNNKYKPYCNRYGSFRKWNIKDKDKNFIQRFKCKDCNSHYSITTDTIFENHKYPLKIYLLAIFIFVNSAKGISSLQLSRDLAIRPKFSFVILHKIRTALFNQYEVLNQNKLKGTIQMDGAYINYLPKKKNKKKDRVDRRELKHLNQECIMTMREVKGNKNDRSYAFIIKNENKSDIERLINLYIEPKSTIISDEHISYSGIEKISNINGETLYNHKSVNHSEEYQNDDGVNNNFAESYFTRLRRMVIGQHHKLSKKYLELYVNEITYRENVRKWNVEDIVIDLIGYCMSCSHNTNFNGYFQRNNSKIKDLRDFEVGNKDYVEEDKKEEKSS